MNYLCEENIDSDDENFDSVDLKSSFLVSLIHKIR